MNFCSQHKTFYTKHIKQKIHHTGRLPPHSQNRYKTKDVVRFLRDKHTMHPKPLTSIFEKLVQLLEHLTHSPADAQAQRRDSLTKMLSESSSPLRILHNVLAEAQKNPSHAADMLSETQDHFNSFKRGLQKLQHALVPAVKDPTFSRFIDKFLALPDPGSQLLKIHKLLNYRDFTEQDEMEPMLKSNNGIITSSTHGYDEFRFCFCRVSPVSQHLVSSGAGFTELVVDNFWC